MPASVVKEGDKYRVVEPGGGLVRGPSGRPVDGGGFRIREMAERQARAINASKHRRLARRRNRRK